MFRVYVNLPEGTRLIYIQIIFTYRDIQNNNKNNNNNNNNNPDAHTCSMYGIFTYKTG